jgi:hypothetical protein
MSDPIESINPHEVFRMNKPLPLLALAALLLAAGRCRAETDVATLLPPPTATAAAPTRCRSRPRSPCPAATARLDKERRYTVFTQAQRRSLVLMRSPAEAGQKVLMLGDDFWLLMPGSQRPLRITPSQKLLGDASTGDIATLSWADDYGGSAGRRGQPVRHPSPAQLPAPEPDRQRARG